MAAVAAISACVKVRNNIMLAEVLDLDEEDEIAGRIRHGRGSNPVGHYMYNSGVSFGAPEIPLAAVDMVHKLGADPNRNYFKIFTSMYIRDAK
ncbi:hypothetical protein B484DRAFT_396300 [Ochromonadaceae sp. CCMP2298]|nr:hypothetical protein B484DRAFT_396300 [Ochromonadaceae sp. CCMP2298]